MPRIFGMDLSFHPTNDHDHDHAANNNDRHPSRHRSYRNHSRETTRAIEPRNHNPNHTSRPRSQRHHSPPTTRSPAPRQYHYSQDTSDSDSNSNFNSDFDFNSETEHAPGLALALRHPQRNQNQNHNPDPNHNRALAIRDPLKAYDQASQDERRPSLDMDVRRGSVRGLNPYGDGEFRGEWMQIQSRDPVSYQGNDDSDLARGRTLRDASRRELGEGENRLTVRQDRASTQPHIPNDAPPPRQNPNSNSNHHNTLSNEHRRTPHRTASTNINNPTKSLSTESSTFTEHILTTTEDSETGQRQRQRTGKVAATFSRKGADGRLEMGGFRGGW